MINREEFEAQPSKAQQAQTTKAPGQSPGAFRFQRARKPRQQEIYLALSIHFSSQSSAPGNGR